MGAVVQPAGHRRSVPLAESPSEDGLGQAVDLEQDHARDVRAVVLADTARPPANEAELTGVVVDAEGGRQQHEADREEEGHQHRASEGGRGAVDDVDRQGDDRGVQDQRAQAECQDGQRQEKPDQEWPEQGVEDGDQRGREQDRAEARDVDSG
jgi:hypothetical protein